MTLAARQTSAISCQWQRHCDGLVVSLHNAKTTTMCKEDYLVFGGFSPKTFDKLIFKYFDKQHNNYKQRPKLRKIIIIIDNRDCFTVVFVALYI